MGSLAFFVLIMSCFILKYIVYLFPVLQITGRTLPVETICLQTSSFATSIDVSWSREVVRDASISSVSVGFFLEQVKRGIDIHQLVTQSIFTVYLLVIRVCLIPKLCLQ